MASAGKAPKIEIRDIPWRRALARASVSLIDSILARAFPEDGTAAKDAQGQAVPALSPAYEEAKKKGGMQVQIGASTRRVGPRPGVPDQRLTSLTARGLGVVQEGVRRFVIGFRDARSRKVAEYLQDRNNFWPETNDERRKALDEAGKVLQGSGLQVRIRDGVMRVKIPLGGGKR